MVKPAMKKKPSATRSSFGGTLMGFVIGLLVGLGAALAVAVYVTRVPIPFVDRNVSRNADQDALEAERNKGWNPNRALGGANAPAAPAPAAPAAQAPGAIVVPPADGQALPPPTSGTSRPAGDPLGDLAQSRAGQPAAAAPAAPAAATPPAPGADPFTYFVQAGAFRTPEDAEAQRAKLAMLGIDAAISEREQNGRTVFRVRVGPFNQKALADLTLEQLQVNNIESALVRIQR